VQRHHQLGQLVVGQRVGVDGPQVIDGIAEISNKTFHRTCREHTQGV